MPRLTPIERAIEGPDRGARYRQRQREKGLVRVALTVPEGEVEYFKELARLVTKYNDPERARPAQLDALYQRLGSWDAVERELERVAA